MFHAARPVFLDGLDRTQNVQAGFVWTFDAPVGVALTLRCAAATFYRASLDGRLIAHGPARAAHGLARVDEIALSPLSPGPHHLAIEVAGYALECYYVPGDASFLQAELRAGDAVLAASGPETRALRLTQRQPAERFSHARCAGEVYRLDAAFTGWRVGDFGGHPPHAVAVVPGPRALLPRGVPLPDFSPRAADRLIGVHTLRPDPAVVVRPIAPLEHGEYLAYAESLPERPATECCRERPGGDAPSVARTGDGWRVTPAGNEPAALDFDFCAMQAGFLDLDFVAAAPGTVDVVFVDHLESDGTLYARTGDMNGVVRLHVPAGRTRLVAFEPHCLRYARVIARGTGPLTLRSPRVLDYAYPDTPAGTFLCSDGDLNRVYAAARHTLRLNTLDVFMDCPGRERAGWLCDSLFSGRAMMTLFGDPGVERAMLENFLHAPESQDAPGYFPECYPGKRIVGGNFIPNWSMFLGLELAEYVRRTGDMELRDAYRERIERLVNGIRSSTNRFGLLQDLPGFTFLDWSAANDDAYKTPISVATNALFARMLDALAGTYDRDDWFALAGDIRSRLRRHVPADASVPDALRPDGDALRSGDRTSEASQYYLFWTGLLAPHVHRDAWRRLVECYGPSLTRPDAGEPLAESNVFIGLYLRMELLAQAGLTERLLAEMRALFLPMLRDGPGTLWEHRKLEGSVCHGFAAHAAVWLVRDVLGIGLPDAIARTIDLTPDPAGLAWARGGTLVEGHVVSVAWTHAPGRFTLTATVPPGYTGVLRLPTALRQWTRDGAAVGEAHRFEGTLQWDLTP